MVGVRDRIDYDCNKLLGGPNLSSAKVFCQYKAGKDHDYVGLD